MQDVETSATGGGRSVMDFVNSAWSNGYGSESDETHNRISRAMTETVKRGTRVGGGESLFFICDSDVFSRRDCMVRGIEKGIYNANRSYVLCHL